MIPNKNIRVGLICNTDIASALAGQLAAESKLAGIAVLDHNASYFKQIFADTGIREESIQVIDTAFWKEQLADWFLAIQADTAIVFAFPYCIPQHILDLPRWVYIIYIRGHCQSIAGLIHYSGRLKIRNNKLQ